MTGTGSEPEEYGLCLREAHRFLDLGCESLRGGWPDIEGLAADAGLAVRRLEWPHPRQTWFAAALDDATADRAVASLD